MRDYTKYHCPVETAIDVIGGKWKVLIIWQLRGGALRFSELKRQLPMVTPTMFTKQLRELEQDGIIIREVFPEVPVRVEYSISETGMALTDVLDSLNKWGRFLMSKNGFEWKKTCEIPNK